MALVDHVRSAGRTYPCSQENYPRLSPGIPALLTTTLSPTKPTTIMAAMVAIVAIVVVVAVSTNQEHEQQAATKQLAAMMIALPMLDGLQLVACTYTPCW